MDESESISLNMGGMDAASATEQAAPAEAVKQETPSSDAGSTLLTRQEDTAQPKAQEGKAQSGQEEVKQTDPAHMVPERAEDYALQFDNGVNVDQGLLSKFQSVAHELGMPQGQAQKLADLYAGYTAESMEKQLQAQSEVVKGWEKEIQSRPGFQTEVAAAKHTLAEFGGSELNTLMNQTLLGSHPIFFDFIVKVGKALGEPEARGRGTGEGKGIPLADRLWPDMK